MTKIVRLTESDLTRIVKRVIMESESPAYDLYVERLEEIEDDMKDKYITDEELDYIREELEDEKKEVKFTKYLSDSEKKRLNNKINSLIYKLKGMYSSDY